MSVIVPLFSPGGCHAFRGVDFAVFVFVIVVGVVVAAAVVVMEVVFPGPVCTTR